MTSTRTASWLLGTLAALTTVVLPAGAAAAETCVVPTPATAGAIPWQLRGASGLATVPASPGVLFTHNDRGIRDSPAPEEDTTTATVWAMTAEGTLLARLRLVDAAGAPIAYFDTEAISADRSGRLVLADTGTNVDARVTVALYRFTPPVVTTTQKLVTLDVPAEVISVQYFTTNSGTTPLQLNVETFFVDAAGSAWFVPRTTTRPYSYTASASALDASAATRTPLRAVRSTRFTVNGPMTDASMMPDGSAVLVKTPQIVYSYLLEGRSVASALTSTPCQVASAAGSSSPGYGEAIAAHAGGGFTTVKESAKTLHSGTGAPIWRFTP